MRRLDGACYAVARVAAVIVARYERRSDVAPLVKAALDGDIAYVTLTAPPPAGRQTLQVWCNAELVVALSAELVGSGREGGEYPLRLEPIDPSHLPELAALAAGVNEPDDRTLADPTEDRTLASAVAPSRDEEPPVSSSDSSDGEIVAATTVFDPDQLLRAPPSKNDDESLTIPRSLSSPPPVRHSRPPPPVFTDDESLTLPGSTRSPSPPTQVDDASEAAFEDRSASWNVRIAPNTQDPLCGRLIGGGKYILDSVIGEGAIGIVFKASHKDLGRTVAIKVLHPRYRDDPGLLEVFRTEARAASLLEHPHLARVYDYGQESDGLVYIVMEFLSGYTLGSVLRARRKITPARAAEIMIQACGALSAAHDREIVHRDVKPDNIVLVPAQDDEGQPMEVAKVCDFGIAALGSNTPLTEDHAAGTPEYMAPEQTTGSAISPAADVYACGIVLYEMLTGEVPFRSDQAFRILMKHRSEAPRPPGMLTPGLNRALESIVMRCLEKRPENRYRSARELRVELRRIADTL